MSTPKSFFNEAEKKNVFRKKYEYTSIQIKIFLKSEERHYKNISNIFDIYFKMNGIFQSIFID